MKDSQHVISVTKPLNLFDLNIRPVEICWSKVKMTSSRWIACCHRRLVQTQQFSPQRQVLQRAVRATEHVNTRTEEVAARRGSSPTFVRSLATNHPHYYQHSTPVPSNHSSNLNGGGQIAKTPVYPNGSISTSYQTPPRHRQNGHHHHQQHRSSNHHNPQSHPHHPHHLNITTSATPSPRQTPSANSSPLSGNSSSAVLFELGRKSSSSSSSSSTNSFTLVGDPRYGKVNNTSMKHSRSTIDIASSGGGRQQQQQQPLRHQQHYYQRPRDDSTIGMPLCPLPPPPPLPSIENTITIISPLDGLLINCQTTEDSNCAQISPALNVIAVSNEYWVAFYSIKSNECLGTLQFPGHCRFWTWIKADTVAVVTEEKVFHWSLSGGVNGDSNYLQSSNGCGAFLREIFDIEEEIADNQITDYATDPLFGNWCALSTLYVDDDGDIGGKVQIYSHSYRKSQCIDAHSAIFTAYQFDDSDQRSTLLVAAIRQRNRTWKLHIIELGPIPSGNISHKPIHHMLNAHNVSPKVGLEPLVNGGTANGSGHQTEDIPTHIVADSEVGLVYLLSKYGALYICDLETGAPLFFEHLSTVMGADGGAPIFTLTADAATESLVAVSRSGQVLSIAVSLPALLRQSAENAKVGQKVLERIRTRLRRLKRWKAEDEQQEEEVAVMNNGDQGNCQLSEEGVADSASTGSTSESTRDGMQHLQQQLNNGHNNNANSSSNGYNSIDSAHSSTTTSSTSSSSFRHRPPVKPKPKPKPKPPGRYHFGEAVNATGAFAVNGGGSISSSEGKRVMEELAKSGDSRFSQQPAPPFPEPPFDGKDDDEPDNEQITRL